MKRGRGYWVGVVGGISFFVLILILRKNGVIERYGSFDYAMVVGSVVLILAGLPVVVLAAKKEAVPARNSDWIGYAVILAVLLTVAGIGYAVIRG